MKKSQYIKGIEGVFLVYPLQLGKSPRIIIMPVRPVIGLKQNSQGPTHIGLSIFSHSPS